MTSEPRAHGWLGLSAVVLLAAASPGSCVPGGGALVVPGLAAWYAVVTSTSRPWLVGYLMGLGHFLVLAGSLRHVQFAAYVAVAVVGAVYFLLTVWVTRRAARWLPGGLAFAGAVTTAEWLRSAMPEIPYPHAQPAHALYQWAWLLGPMRWGGEPLANWIVALASASAVDFHRSWRSAVPPFGRSAALAVAAPLVWLATCLMSPPAAAAGTPVEVDVAAIEPGFGAAFQYDAEAYWDRFETHLREPTLAVAGRRVVAPPDLVLWPETAFPIPLVDEPPRLREAGVLVPLAPRTMLIGGTLRDFGSGRMAVAVAVDGHGRLLGWHEKRHPVPAGERFPFLDLLPRAARDAALAWGRSIIGFLPDLRAGQHRAPLRTAHGVPFGVMMCFDNAFVDVAADHVQGGARFLVVLSNESWYRHGTELEQMVAMTVCRAIETRTPIVRCTVDGATVAVDGCGRIIARLPLAPTLAGAPRVLRVALAAGPGRLPPWSGGRGPTGLVLVLFAGLAAVLPGRRPRAVG
jgi:apolipoprotein N-acyltransferase